MNIKVIIKIVLLLIILCSCAITVPLPPLNVSSYQVQELKEEMSEQDVLKTLGMPMEIMNLTPQEEKESGSARLLIYPKIHKIIINLDVQT